MFKKTLIALSALLASTAFAANYGSPSLIVGAAGYSFGTTALPVSGEDFTDTFEFQLGSGSGTQARFEATFYDLSVTENDISYGTLSLPNITFTLNGVAKNSLAAAVIPGSTGTALAAASFTGLTVGTAYTLTVEGKGVGDNATTGSYYLGNSYNITVAAVPEPESYAMLLAGLGLMGAIARRRKNNA